jgi:hypothetical protein
MSVERFPKNDCNISSRLVVEMDFRVDLGGRSFGWWTKNRTIMEVDHLFDKDRM